MASRGNIGNCFTHGVFFLCFFKSSKIFSNARTLRQLCELRCCEMRVKGASLVCDLN